MKTVAAALAFAGAALAQQPPIKIAGIVELSGTGATSGTNFDNGVKLAVKEINAAGGILGRKIDYTRADTQSNPQIAKALAQKAVDDDAYVVMGPVFSGSIIVSMAETQARRDPQLHRRRGGEHHAAGQSVHLPHVVHADRRRCPRSRATSRTAQGEDASRSMWVNNDFGKGGRDTIAKALERAGHQGRRRHLDRSGPGRFLRRRAEGQAVERRRAVRLHQRGRVGARAARAAQAGLRQADRRRDDADQPEGDRARRRSGQRRGGARRPDRRCAAAGDQGVRRRSSRRNTSTRATTTASRATAACTWSRR